MNIFYWVVLSSFLISLISWIGLLTILIKRDLLDHILLILVAFSAGGMMGGAFLHLIPEAISEVGSSSNTIINIFLYLLVGFSTFFILEQFIEWYHEHTDIHKKKPASYLVLVSDMIHNFIDGLVIAGSFSTSLHVGLITTLVIALHEIPQELGDFGIMVYGGFKKFNALLLNYVTASTVMLGGIVGYYLASIIEHTTVFLLSFAAGNFIYIAASDLIPEIKHGENFNRNLLHFLFFLIGVLIMLAFKSIIE